MEDALRQFNNPAKLQVPSKDSFPIRVNSRNSRAEKSSKSAAGHISVAFVQNALQ